MRLCSSCARVREEGPEKRGEGRGGGRAYQKKEHELRNLNFTPIIPGMCVRVLQYSMEYRTVPYCSTGVSFRYMCVQMGLNVDPTREGEEASGRAPLPRPRQRQCCAPDQSGFIFYIFSTMLAFEARSDRQTDRQTETVQYRTGQIQHSTVARALAFMRLHMSDGPMADVIDVPATAAGWPRSVHCWLGS